MKISRRADRSVPGERAATAPIAQCRETKRPTAARTTGNRRLTNRRPKIGKNVFIHPSAVVEGRVTLGDSSSVWPGAVLRGDINRIEVGRFTNIQDLSVLHVERDKPCRIGDHVVVGHSVILHACTVKKGSLIGMGSIVQDGAVIGPGTLLGAGSLVPEGHRLKPESLYFGRPAKFIRKLSRREVRGLTEWARRYARLAEAHLAGRFESPIITP